MNVLRSMLKVATELAFSPNKDADVDSVLLLTPDASDYQTLMTQNMCKLARRFQTSQQFGLKKFLIYNFLSYLCTQI